MRKLLILSFSILLGTSAHAVDYNFIVQSLMIDAKAACEQFGGTFQADGSCTVNRTGAEFKNASKDDILLAAEFQKLCSANSGQIETDTGSSVRYGVTYTCWFPTLKNTQAEHDAYQIVSKKWENATTMTNQEVKEKTTDKDLKQLELCDKMNKELKRFINEDRVSWHGRNSYGNQPTERGCYMFTPYVQ